jgi:hypothetical protein
MSDEKNFPSARAEDDGIGYLSAHPLSVSVKGPYHEQEGINESENCQLKMFDKVGDDRSINDDESDGYSETSDEPGNLTDSSSDDDTVAPGGHVKRIVKGIEKLRRVRRVAQPRPFVPIRHDCEEEPPGLHTCSEEEDYHDSDEDSNDDLFPEDNVRKSAVDSNAGTLSSNGRNHCALLRPSRIEETAIIVNEAVKDELNMGFSGISAASAYSTSDVIVSEEDMRHLTEDGVACRNTKSRPITSISLLQQVKKSGISAVNRPDEWIALDVTVDSGACVTVMPSDLCPGIQIVENDLSRNGIEYEVANGESIANLGEKRCQVMTIGSMAPKKIIFQIADVHKPLLSVTACSDMGYDCYLGKDGGSLRDRVTGEIIPLQRQGSLYTLRMWVRQWPDNPNAGFPGPA